VRKVKEGETTNDIFAFLTTEPNAIVAPIHPKAMPVILTSASGSTEASGVFAHRAIATRQPGMVRATSYASRCAILAISAAIPSGDKMRSTHPLAIALSGMSGCSAVSSF
jgi:hypothetical protein